MFSTMVDVNGDGVVSEQELQQSLADCAAIDAAVTGRCAMPRDLHAARARHAWGRAAQGAARRAPAPASPACSGERDWAMRWRRA